MLVCVCGQGCGRLLTRGKEGMNGEDAAHGDGVGEGEGEGALEVQQSSRGQSLFTADWSKNKGAQLALVVDQLASSYFCPFKPSPSFLPSHYSHSLLLHLHFLRSSSPPPATSRTHSASPLDQRRPHRKNPSLNRRLFVPYWHDSGPGIDFTTTANATTLKPRRE